MPNPFYYGGHVSPEQFVGRKAELARIFSALEVAHSGQMQSVSVVGPRRIGKSSLLFYIANRYSQYLKQSANYRVAYVDLQDADCKTLDGLLRKILKDLKLAPPRGGALTLSKFQDAILGLKNSATYPVVCLDEFEELTQKPAEFTGDLYDSWRYLMGESAIAFVTASKTSLKELANAERITSPFFNTFTSLLLAELTDDEAIELIDRGVKCDMPFGDAERNKMFVWAGNHPAKLQLAGQLIYNARANGEPLDWDNLRVEFERLLEQVGLDKPITKSARRKLSNAAHWFFASFPKMIGRAILESVFFRKKDEISESTTWIVGTSAIVFLILVILGAIALDWKTINEIIIGRLRGTAK